MRLYEFDSYEQYRDIQTAANLAKHYGIWVFLAEIDQILAYASEHKITVNRVLCHGARNGAEVMFFRSRRISAAGTDISHTASEYGLTQWDFHDHNPDWEAQFDIVYSNALDHAFDPELALKTWRGQLRPGGLLALHWCVGNENEPYHNNGADCIRATVAEMQALVLKLFGGIATESSVVRPKDRVIIYGRTNKPKRG